MRGTFMKTVKKLDNCMEEFPWEVAKEIPSYATQHRATHTKG